MLTRYKETEIGKIPEDWKEKKVAAQIELCYGKSLPQRKRAKGTVPVYGSNGITGSHNESLIKGPGVIVGRKGSVGEVVFSKTDFWPIDTTYFVKLKNKGDVRFWYYFLNTLSLNKMNSHSAVPGLNRDNVYGITVLLPFLSEQRAIAKILSDLDNKVELNQQMNKTLEAIGQALFKRWFVDFEFPNKAGKPYKSSGGEMADSELGEIPKGWHISKLRDFAEILNGFAFKSEDFVDSGVFLLRTRNFTEDRYIIRDDTACLPQSFYDEYKSFRLKKFDVLLVMVGASVGKMALVQSSVLPALQNQNMWNFRSKSRSGQLFLNFLVKKIVKENMGTASGSARDFFRKDYFRSIDFILPSNNILKDFDKRVCPIFDRINKNLAEIQILSQIRDSLLPRLMSGKIQVKKERYNGKS